jgi:hypothetical protein
MQAGTLELLLQGGAVGLLAMVLIGLFLILRLIIPAAKEFLLGLVANIAALNKSIAEVPHHIALSEERVKAHVSGALGRVEDTVRLEADRTGEGIKAVTFTHAVETLRQQSDPNLLLALERERERERESPTPKHGRDPRDRHTPPFGQPALRLPPPPPSRPGKPRGRE